MCPVFSSVVPHRVHLIALISRLAPSRTASSSTISIIMACANCAGFQQQLELLENNFQHATEARRLAEALIQTLLVQLDDANTRADTANTRADTRAAEHAAAMERLARENAEAMERQTVAHRNEVIQRVNQLQIETRRLFAPFRAIQATHKRMRGTSFTGLASDDQKYVILAEEDEHGAGVWKLRYGQQKHVQMYQNQPALDPPSFTGSGASLRAFVTRKLRQEYHDDPLLVCTISSIVPVLV